MQTMFDVHWATLFGANTETEFQCLKTVRKTLGGTKLLDYYLHALNI